MGYKPCHTCNNLRKIGSVIDGTTGWELVPECPQCGDSAYWEDDEGNAHPYTVAEPSDTEGNDER